MGKFTAYKLPLKSLAAGTYDYEYHLGKQFFTDMESADIHDADLDVKLAVTHKRDIYRLDFTITGTITHSIAVKYGEDYNDEADDLLIIPESDNFLNVAYMLYDTVALTIPIKHVHPMGKCNRQMSAMLRKHRAHRPGDEDAELEDTLIDEMESMDTDRADTPTDPRWDGLKALSSDSSADE